MITEQLFVQDGQEVVVVTNTSVFITDLDTPPSQLIITVGSSPEHGNVCHVVSSYS